VRGEDAVLEVGQAEPTSVSILAQSRKAERRECGVLARTLKPIVQLIRGPPDCLPDIAVRVTLAPYGAAGKLGAAVDVGVDFPLQLSDQTTDASAKLPTKEGFSSIADRALTEPFTAVTQLLQVRILDADRHIDAGCDHVQNTARQLVGREGRAVRIEASAGKANVLQGDATAATLDSAPENVHGPSDPLAALRDIAGVTLEGLVVAVDEKLELRLCELSRLASDRLLAPKLVAVRQRVGLARIGVPRNHRGCKQQCLSGDEKWGDAHRVSSRVRLDRGLGTSAIGTYVRPMRGGPLKCPISGPIASSLHGTRHVTRRGKELGRVGFLRSGTPGWVRG
jgi:hypothetical protein